MKCKYSMLVTILSSLKTLYLVVVLYLNASNNVVSMYASVHNIAVNCAKGLILEQKSAMSM